MHLEKNMEKEKLYTPMEIHLRELLLMAIARMHRIKNQTETITKDK